MNQNKQMVIGYTQGVYDTLHIGHLNLLENARKNCDYLIVGVNSDELVRQYKHKTPIINENDRARIVAALRFVDEVHIVDTLDKKVLYEKYKFNTLLIGSDHKGTARWLETETQMAPLNVSVKYLPHTDGVSSSDIRVKMGV